MVHVAGIVVSMETRVRQRCGWCGAVLIDVDTAHMAVFGDVPMEPATWEVGALVALEGEASWIVVLSDGDELPADSCGSLDPTVTG